MVGILDIYANFGDDQLKGFGMVWIPLAFVVIFTALSHYGASVWLVSFHVHRMKQIFIYRLWNERKLRGGVLLIVCRDLCDFN